MFNRALVGLLCVAGAIVLAGFVANVVPVGQIMFYLAALFD